jgi:hypothetical protein
MLKPVDQNLDFALDCLQALLDETSFALDESHVRGLVVLRL